MGWINVIRQFCFHEYTLITPLLYVLNLGQLVTRIFAEKRVAVRKPHAFFIALLLAYCTNTQNQRPGVLHCFLASKIDVQT